MNKNTIFYHGNENKEHKFSEYKPCFFTEDPKYAECYGSNVKPYKLDINQPFDTSNDEQARNYYNREFRSSSLGLEAKEIKIGEHIHFMDADNFFAFLSVEEELGNGFGYDCIIVNEKSEGFNDNGLSIIPLKIDQINPIKLKIKNKIKLK